MVSVIIPAYNVEKYIREALDSVVNQTYTDLDIIIVDDGSTDHSGAICDEYAKNDSRIRVIHQENHGLGLARNAGLDIMKGQYVVFLDPDDAYRLSYIDEMLQAIEKQNADIVMCKYLVCKTDGTLSNFRSSIIMPSVKSGTFNRVEALRAFLDGRISFSACDKIYRSTLWKNIRFIKTRYAEDQDANLRVIARCSKLFIIDRDLYLYRTRPGSIMNSSSPQKTRDKIRIRNRFNRNLAHFVPEVLTETQMADRLKAAVFDRIKDYLDCYDKTEKEWQPLKRSIKKLVITEYNRIGKDNFRLRTKLAYHMMFICPKFLRWYLSFYHNSKELIWKGMLSIKAHCT